MASIVTARHAIITRTLPTMSPTGPSTGCTSANGSAKAVVSSATAFGSTWMSWAIGGNDRVGRARGERRDEADQAQPRDQAARLAIVRLLGEFRFGLRGDGQKIAVERPAGIEFGLEIHVVGKSHTRISPDLLCSAGMPHPTIAWGRNREVFLVIGPSSSRTERPQGLAPAIHEPMAA